MQKAQIIQLKASTNIKLMLINSVDEVFMTTPIYSWGH